MPQIVPELISVRMFWNVICGTVSGTGGGPLSRSRPGQACVSLPRIRNGAVSDAAVRVSERTQYRWLRGQRSPGRADRWAVLGVSDRRSPCGHPRRTPGRDTGQGQMLMFVCQTVAMSGRARGLWPFAAAGVIAVVTVAGLVAVWRSPHRAELEGFAGFAISVAGIAAGWIAWVWRHEEQPGQRGCFRARTRAAGGPAGRGSRGGVDPGGW